MTWRDLLVRSHRETARRLAQAQSAGADGAAWPSAPARSGWCVITDAADAEDGGYEITELWWDPAADGGSGGWTECVSPPGLVEVAAVEAAGATIGEADDQCPFWQTRATDGTWCTHILLQPGPAVLWGKATDTWNTDPPVFDPNVDVNPCDDLLGNNPDTSVTDNVFLHPGTAMQDPQVRTGDVIPYVRLANGHCHALATPMEDKIGTVKVWHDAGNIPAGWQLADGTNGTRDLRGRFVVGYQSGDSDFGAVGNTGGNKTHTHDAHDLDHDHPLDLENAGNVNDGGTMHGGHIGDTYGPNTGGESPDLSNVTHTAADHKPPYYVLVWIQRVS